MTIKNNDWSWVGFPLAHVLVQVITGWQIDTSQTTESLKPCLGVSPLPPAQTNWLEFVSKGWSWYCFENRTLLKESPKMSRFWLKVITSSVYTQYRSFLNIKPFFLLPTLYIWYVARSRSYSFYSKNNSSVWLKFVLPKRSDLSFLELWLFLSFLHKPDSSTLFATKSQTSIQTQYFIKCIHY